MKGANCSNCGKRLDVRLPIGGKASVACPECSKPLMVKRDKSGVSVKAFEEEPEPRKTG